MFVGVDASQSNYEVVRLESLRGEECSRSEAFNVSREMYEKMKLWFIKPLGCPEGRCAEKVVDGRRETFLPPRELRRLLLQVL